MQFMREIVRGIFKDNPIFRLVLGMCPTLAVTTKVENGLGMGLAATFVLSGSNLAVSALRNVIPSKVRLPCYIVIIATFVTIVDLLMNAFAHELHKNLGIFIPLIVVNCIILARAEAFASKQNVWLSIADAIGIGIGFTLSLVLISAIREIGGAGTLTIWGSFGWTISGLNPALIFILAPGGFVTLGCLLAGMNHVQTILARRAGKPFQPPLDFDCRHCTICRFGS